MNNLRLECIHKINQMKRKNPNCICMYYIIGIGFRVLNQALIDDLRKADAMIYERRLGRKPMSRYQKHCAYRYMPRREAKKEMINDHARKFRKFGSTIEYILYVFNQQEKNRIYSDEELAYIRSLRQNFDWAGFATEVHNALYEMEL